MNKLTIEDIDSLENVLLSGAGKPTLETVIVILKQLADTMRENEALRHDIERAVVTASELATPDKLNFTVAGA